jgi:hypothetical protein
MAHSFLFGGSGFHCDNAGVYLAKRSQSIRREPHASGRKNRCKLVYGGHRSRFGNSYRCIFRDLEVMQTVAKVFKG